MDIRKIASYDERLANIQIGQMYTFLYAAEYENFTLTAKKLNMTQTTVSRNISALEEELQLKLFEREHNKVHLTLAGRGLEQEWRKILSELKTSYVTAVQLGRHQYDLLSVANNNALEGYQVITPIIQAFNKAYSQVNLCFEEADESEIMELLQARKFDIALEFYFRRQEYEEAGFSWKLLKEDRMCLAMSRKHPLAAKEKITFADMRDQRLIVVDRKVLPSLYELLESQCFKNGFFLHNVYQVRNLYSALLALLRGKGIFLCDSSFCASYDDRIRKVPLEHVPGGIIAVWRKSNSNPYIRRFLAKQVEEEQTERMEEHEFHGTRQEL